MNKNHIIIWKRKKNQRKLTNSSLVFSSIKKQTEGIAVITEKLVYTANHISENFWANTTKKPTTKLYTKSITKEILKKQPQEKRVYPVFIDLVKAFDREKILK